MEANWYNGIGINVSSASLIGKNMVEMIDGFNRNVEEQYKILRVRFESHVGLANRLTRSMTEAA